MTPSGDFSPLFSNKIVRKNAVSTVEAKAFWDPAVSQEHWPPLDVGTMIEYLSDMYEGPTYSLTKIKETTPQSQ